MRIPKADVVTGRILNVGIYLRGPQADWEV